MINRKPYYDLFLTYCIQRQKIMSKARTRLSPEVRKKQLLSTAKGMIVNEGLQTFTMEALARTAGVTSPLVYNYFSSRQILLQDLLTQVYTEFTSQLTQEVSAAKSFEEIVTVFIASNFDHHSPGNILPILLSQPDIASSIKKIQKEQSHQMAGFLVRNTADKYKLSKPQAELLTSMSSGASIAAAGYAARGRVNRKKTIQTALTYMLAGMEKVASQSQDQ
ncbi:MAG: AcrR family transcriptional regulator [Candidatus Azotimanducaceae bacterium]